MIELDELRERVVGWAFPGGSYTVEGYQAWLCHDAILSPPLPAGIAHPMYVYYIAMGGMGVSLESLFKLIGASNDSGVMFGEAGIEQREPLQRGHRYRVSGEITEVVRKSGKRAGTFDIVSFRLDLYDDSDTLVGVSTNSFVFPRRDRS